MKTDVLPTIPMSASPKHSLLAMDVTLSPTFLYRESLDEGEIQKSMLEGEA
jgi:hypothetical protein